MRPKFLCMIDSINLSTDPSDINRKFVLHSKTKPTIGIDTPQYAVRLWTTDPSMISFDKEHGLLLLLYGEIFNTSSNDQLSWLIQDYVRNGLEFAKTLNGSFVIILVDSQKDCVAVITDRVNSRKAYHSMYAGSHWVSNCLYSHPLRNVDLDSIGVAWYLLNKTTFHNRTLFDGIRTLDRASIHEIKSYELYKRQYWNYKFDHSYEDVDPKRLSVELSDMLVESIRRRTRDGAQIFLSLSAGYDATTILGIMRYKLRMDAVQCFSYSSSKIPSKKGDAYLAHKMAHIAGYDHRIVQGYDGDIMEWINRNGSMGNGTSTCGEIDAIIKLFEQPNHSHKRRVFMGDEIFGWYDCALETHRDVLDELTIHDWSAAPLLSEIIEQEMCLRMQNGIAGDQAAIVAKYHDTKNLHDLIDIIFLDQRLSNYLQSHKEYFMGNFVSVSNPFLDNDILDFMMKIPVSLRLNKNLFKRTVSEMFPQLFAINRAKSTEYFTDWGKEILKCQKEIEALLLSRKSILDELIPPKKIVEFMKNGLSSRTSLIPKGWSKIKSNAFRTVNAFRKIASAPRRPEINKISRVELLRRILVIRSFINNTIDHNA